ncbi:hypothetical protein QTP88_028936 [Uroleucon formosanum]
MGKDLKLTGLDFRKLSLEKPKAKQKEKYEIASTSTVISMDYVSDENLIDENLTDKEEIINLESPGPSNIKRARKEIINHRLSAALDK